MSAASIINELVYYIEYNSMGLEGVALEMLRVAVDKLGVAQVAQIDTPQMPVGSKTDDFYLRMRKEQFEKDWKEKEKEILKMLNLSKSKKTS